MPFMPFRKCRLHPTPPLVHLQDESLAKLAARRQREAEQQEQEQEQQEPQDQQERQEQQQGHQQREQQEQQTVLGAASPQAAPGGPGRSSRVGWLQLFKAEKPRGQNYSSSALISQDVGRTSGSGGHGASPSCLGGRAPGNGPLQVRWHGDPFDQLLCQTPKWWWLVGREVLSGCWWFAVLQDGPAPPLHP